MAAKPTKLPRWGDVSGDIVEPSSGKKDVGWVDEEKPPAQFFNWLLDLIFQWTDYLNDGALTGNHSIDGNLDITTGSVDIVNGNLDITDGDLDVAGTALVASHIESTTGKVKTSESGIRHAARTIFLAAAAGQGDTTGTPADFTTSGNISRWQTTASINEINFPIPVQPGDRITAVKFHVKDAVGTTMTGRLMHYLAAGGTSVDTVVSDNSGTDQVMPLAGLGAGHTVLSEFYEAQVVTNGATGGLRVYGVEVTFDRL